MYINIVTNHNPHYKQNYLSKDHEVSIITWLSLPWCTCVRYDMFSRVKSKVTVLTDVLRFEGT